MGFKSRPPGKNEIISVGMDVWFLNQVDAVQQVFDANLFQGFTNGQLECNVHTCPWSFFCGGSLWSPDQIIDLEWLDSRLSWNRTEYGFDSIEVPGSSIWLPYFKIQAIVNEVDLKLRPVLMTPFDLIVMRPKQNSKKG